MTIKVNSHGKCPHCSTVVRFIQSEFIKSNGKGNFDATWHLAADISGSVLILYTSTCPACRKLVLVGEVHDHRRAKLENSFILWPRSSYRPIPPEVPEHIADDYNEAAATLSISPKASAALSRRCLQAVLVEKGGANPKRNLAQQIDEVIPHLPAYIAESIDAVRNIGNFAAHPQKSLSSGEIIDVEPGESEWNLEVLDLLFDHYYVKPELAKARRAALDAKLNEVGKHPMK